LPGSGEPLHDGADNAVTALPVELIELTNFYSHASVDVLLQSSPGAVQPDFDICGSQTEALGRLVGIEALDESQGEHGSQFGRETVHRVVQDGAEFAIAGLLLCVSVIR